VGESRNGWAFFSPRMTQSAPQAAQVKRRRSSGEENAAKEKRNFNRDNKAHGATKPGPLRLG
jgi:hypothetical protein